MGAQEEGARRVSRVNFDVRSMVDRDYIGAWDLVDNDGKPRDYTVEIISTEPKKLRSRNKETGKMELKTVPVVRFARVEKGLCLSAKINRETVIDLYGPDTRTWVGKKITLYPTKTLAFGKTVDCIRIRPVAPKGPAEQVETRPVDEEMRARQTEAAEGSA